MKPQKQEIIALHSSLGFVTSLCHCASFSLADQPCRI